MSKALVVLSGGLDSCVALALALKVNDSATTVSFNYGQRHTRELTSARAIAAHYELMHRVWHVHLAQGGVLMEHDEEMPHLTYEELQKAEGPSPTYVPFRNGTLLSHAASIALEIGADTIYAGMHGEDAHNWAYPDCTPEFIGAMQNAIYVGTYHKVRLICPFTYSSKADIVRFGLQLNAPLHLTWSCYEGRDLACGKCPTCIGRLEAFAACDMQDPIEYEFDAQKELLERYRDNNLMKPQVYIASSELRRTLGDHDG